MTSRVEGSVAIILSLLLWMWRGCKCQYTKEQMRWHEREVRDKEKAWLVG